MKKIPLSARLEEMGRSSCNQLWVCQQRGEEGLEICVCHGEKKRGG